LAHTGLAGNSGRSRLRTRSALVSDVPTIHTNGITNNAESPMSAAYFRTVLAIAL
jgi:hypothetical protein